LIGTPCEDWTSRFGFNWRMSCNVMSCNVMSLTSCELISFLKSIPCCILYHQKNVKALPASTPLPSLAYTYTPINAISGTHNMGKLVNVYGVSSLIE
jgi:hypothetical protein